MRKSIEGHFSAADRTQLFYRHWQPEKKKSGKAVVLFHRGHEHSGRFQELVDRLEMSNTTFFAWDCRG